MVPPSEVAGSEERHACLQDLMVEIVGRRVKTTLGTYVVGMDDDGGLVPGLGGFLVVVKRR